MLCTWLLLLITHTVSPALAEPRTLNPESSLLVAPRIDEPVRVDGVLDEPAWPLAEPSVPFRRNRNAELAPIATTGRIMRDADAIYVGITCEEPDMANLAPAPTDPYDCGIWGGDSVELFLDPGQTRSRYYQLIVNVSGRAVHGFDATYTPADTVEVAVQRGDRRLRPEISNLRSRITDSGRQVPDHPVPGDRVSGPRGEVQPAQPASESAWSVEIRIPFEVLRVRAHPGDRWGMNMYRSRAGRRNGEPAEQLAWHPTGAGFRDPHLFGDLLFAGRRKAAATLPSSDQEAEAHQRVLDQVRRDLTGQGRWRREDMNEERAAMRAARLTALSRRIARLGESALIGATQAVTDDAVFPWTVPSLDTLDPVIELAACHGEFEPASFILFATRELEDVAITIDNLLTHDGQRMDPSAIDIHPVLCWYQAGWAHVTPDGRTLVPELLVNDGSLITVDPARRENILHFEGLPTSDPPTDVEGRPPASEPPTGVGGRRADSHDSGSLPTDSEHISNLDIPALESKQVWLTLHVPADAAPGLYRGQVLVEENAETIATAPIRVTVYPFELAPSILSYSLYYRLRPSQIPDPLATMERMAAEVRNQVEHGINMPSTYVGGEALRPGGAPMEALEELTRVYRDLGLRDHPLILVTTAVGRQSSPEQLENTRAMARRFVTWARQRGYSDVYFQGIDEGNLDTLREERAAFQAVHDGGGKAFVACGSDYFDVVGDLLDMPVISGSLHPIVARKAKALGHRAFSYGNPQAGVELPETFRRNYGLKLWVAGYAGGFDYEYQSHDPETAYDEFKAKRYRNHTMAYPAVGKPIDTRQWEGWREGTDDVRYLSTLLHALENAERESRQAPFVQETRRWLAGITGDEDLDALRGEMARRIILLRN